MMSDVIALVGPTAVGKTAVSIHIAQALRGEIISVDSRLLYRGMDIGTAKPGIDEQRQVAHHLIDVIEPTYTWSLAEYLAAARIAMDLVIQSSKVPLLVGGTGQYMTALLEGWQPPPRPQDNKLRESLESRAADIGHEALYHQLMSVDPVSAERIDPRNLRRVIRALEIYEFSGLPASSFSDRESPPYRFVKVGLTLPREELYNRIDNRIDQMLAEGWIEEVRGLMESGVERDAPAMEAIGYRQIADHLTELKSYDEAIAEIRKLTRQFVRRQYNWFKLGDPTIRWFNADQDAHVEMIEYLKDELNG